MSDVLIDRPELASLGQYEFGWHDADAAGATAQRGLSEAVVRDISDAEERARLDAQEPAQGPAAVRAQADAHVGRRPLRDRLRQHQVLRALHREAGADRGRTSPRTSATRTSARHPRGRASAPGRRRRRAVRVRGRVPPDPRGARGAGRHLHGHRHGVAGRRLRPGRGRGHPSPLRPRLHQADAIGGADRGRSGLGWPRPRPGRSRPPATRCRDSLPGADRHRPCWRPGPRA